MAELNVHSERQQAHFLVDALPDEKVSAAKDLLEEMLDPLTRALANVPFDDEPVSEEEARDIVEARAAVARGEIVSNEEVLAEFGLTPEDFERMGQTPLDPEPLHPEQ